MTDLYKILNVRSAASEAEIKKQFRKLATIHHPDKNGGSKKSEDLFKEIVNAYEILSDKDKRARYDYQFNQQHRATRKGPTSQNKRNHQQPPETYKTPPKQKNYRSNYSLWAVGIIVLLIYFFHKNYTHTTTGNSKADKELEQQQVSRPESGEIEFDK